MRLDKLLYLLIPIMLGEVGNGEIYELSIVRLNHSYEEQSASVTYLRRGEGDDFSVDKTRVIL